MQHSTSEKNGLAILSERDQTIYSVGISTAGLAEIHMATASPKRHIIATTIDKEGADFAQTRIRESGLSERIEVKLEDIKAPLPYGDEHFDFVYARLVLHYLSKTDLTCALKELHRIVKKGGKIFVVVRSKDCLEAQSKTSSFDPESGMTTYISESGHSLSRFFHDKDSIQTFLSAAGFHINHIKTYNEQLCIDFHRTKPSKQPDALIEVLASKEK